MISGKRESIKTGVKTIGLLSHYIQNNFHLKSEKCVNRNTESNLKNKLF